MADMLAKEKRNEIPVAVVHMGWQYYTRKSIAAALIAVLLVGITMPEAVIANYRWLVRVVEEFLEDRTRYRYTSNVDETVEFIPLEFGYLPEGFEETRRNKQNNSIAFVFVQNNGTGYFDLTQKILEYSSKYVYGANTNQHYTEIILLFGDNVQIYEKENVLYYLWTHDLYHISGQTNLSKEELIQILTNLTFY